MRAIDKEKFQSVIDNRLRSGLSISDFCYNEHYPVSTFYYWRRKFGFSSSAITHLIRRCSDPTAKASQIYAALNYKPYPYARKKSVVHKSDFEKDYDDEYGRIRSG